MAAASAATSVRLAPPASRARQASPAGDGAGAGATAFG